MTDLTRIADAIHDYVRAKDQAANAKSELLRIAVEDLSIPQTVVCRGDAVTRLDGYLRGRGMAPRSEAADELP